nr:ribonuclease H-like domain-containing protein [Tanacetum cinerariifolium]
MDYEVAPQSGIPLRCCEFGGVTDWYQSTGYRELGRFQNLDYNHFSKILRVFHRCLISARAYSQPHWENDPGKLGAAPNSLRGNFMPPKPDLIFADEHVLNESVTSLPDWVSDSEDENKVETETKQIKPSFLKGNPQKELQERGVINSGCSRNMTRNMSYLSEYEKNDGGYVAFGGDPKGGKFTGKGKIRTRKLDFEDVYFVKELKFTLFSVSQMCDKKNNVLFTDTECVLLSPNFKLLDESQVLLRVPRKNNMYSVDLRNVIPSE